MIVCNFATVGRMCDRIGFVYHLLTIVVNVE